MLQFGHDLAGRGTGAQRIIKDNQKTASIRPRPRRSWNSEGRLTKATKGSRFNSATTSQVVEPDRDAGRLPPGRASIRPRPRRSWNEGGRVPGKVPVPASIRPRPRRSWNRGSGGWRRPAAGCGFNSATTSQVVEHRRWAYPPPRLYQASIRPRPRRSWNRAVPAGQPRRRPASIRPRPRRSWNMGLKEWECLTKANGLQFGHDLAGRGTPIDPRMKPATNQASIRPRPARSWPN